MGGNLKRIQKSRQDDYGTNIYIPDGIQSMSFFYSL
jgi:hypothetical protein